MDIEEAVQRRRLRQLHDCLFPIHISWVSFIRDRQDRWTDKTSTTKTKRTTWSLVRGSVSKPFKAISKRFVDKKKI